MLIIVGIVVGLATFALTLAVQRTAAENRVVVRQRIAADTAIGLSAFIPIPRLEAMSERAARIRAKLDRAGIDLTVTEYTTLRVIVAVIGAALLSLLIGRLDLGAIVSIIFGAIGFFLGYVLPSIWVDGKAKRRLGVLEDQVLDALVSIAKSLRSGLGLTQALEFAADECEVPLGPELKRAVRELQLGADIEVVFEDMNQRLGSGDLEIATTAMMIQRRVGGSLAEILGNVANTIRERRDIRAEVRVLTSRQRLTGNVSALLPVLIALFFFTVNPDVANLLVTTTAGKISLTAGILFELLGLWLIRKLSVIEV